MTDENQQVLPKINVNPIIDDDKNTNLHFAAARGNAEEVLKEIANGHKIDPENYLGWTPLMMATRNGNTEIVTILIDNKADATRKNKFGASIFLMAVTNGNLSLIHLILQHLLCGGVSRQSLETIFSPISMAILFSHYKVIHYLLDQSFNVNHATLDTGITTLMFASLNGNLEIFNLLISKGADLYMKNVNKQTAEDLEKQQASYYQETCYQQQKLPPVVHHNPVYCISPMPSFLNLPPEQMLTRKSSNLISPNYFFTSNLTPVSPITFMPQVFFPPDFQSNTMLSSMHNFYAVNDLLNARLNQSVFLSPVAQHYTNFNYSPCANAQFQ